MKNLHYITTSALMGMMLQQAALQQELLEAQQQIIDLQKQLDKMKPGHVKDNELWHVKSGTTSTDAAQGDLETVRKFKDWNVGFAKKHIKPYVNPKAYAECLNQMTRGLPERISELQSEPPEENKPPEKSKNKKSEIIQLPLAQFS